MEDCQTLLDRVCWWGFSGDEKEVDRFPFATREDWLKYPREDITPPPSRTEEEQLEAARALYVEQQRMAQREPAWAQEMWTKRENPDEARL